MSEHGPDHYSDAVVQAPGGSEIERLRAVVEAAKALVRTWENETLCCDCESKAEAMGGRCDPKCDRGTIQRVDHTPMSGIATLVLLDDSGDIVRVCLERWAVSASAATAHDAFDDALDALAAGEGEK